MYVMPRSRPVAAPDAAEPHVKETVRAISVLVDGQRTSMRLEPVFWEALKRLCDRRRIDLGVYIGEASVRFPSYSRSAAVRCAVLQDVQAAAATHPAADPPGRAARLGR